MMDDQNDVVFLAMASSEVEALLWKESLEDAGVSVLIRAGGPGPGAWASSASFEHNVFVRRDQLALAQNVLQQDAGVISIGARARKQAPGLNPVVKRGSGSDPRK